MALPPIKVWFTWRFEGLEHIPAEGAAIVACNHISYLDPLGNAYAVLRAGRRARFLAKEDLFRIPLVGSVMRGARQIPVDRARAGNPEPLLAAEEALRAGEVVVIYPEGTVTTDPGFKPMKGKTGAVRLSLATGVPIVPMASWGSQDVWQKSGRGSLKFGRPIMIKVGPPIDLSTEAGRGDDRAALGELTARVMRDIAVLVEDLRAKYPRRWSPGGRLPP